MRRWKPRQRVYPVSNVLTQVGLSARTISRVLRRHQVPYLADYDPLPGEVTGASKTTAVRYERRRPDELVRVDAR